LTQGVLDIALAHYPTFVSIKISGKESAGWIFYDDLVVTFSNLAALPVQHDVDSKKNNKLDALLGRGPKAFTRENLHYMMRALYKQ